MESNKLLHPSFDVVRVDGSDKEALETAMVILHQLGWKTQQCGIEAGLEGVKFLQENMQERFIRGCAHGVAALHRLLGREVEAP